MDHFSLLSFDQDEMAKFQGEQGAEQKAKETADTKERRKNMEQALQCEVSASRVGAVMV